MAVPGKSPKPAPSESPPSKRGYASHAPTASQFVSVGFPKRTPCTSAQGVSYVMIERLSYVCALMVVHDALSPRQLPPAPESAGPPTLHSVTTFPMVQPVRD